jgi:predicted DNA-binding protein with PD1-like motif
MMIRQVEFGKGFMGRLTYGADLLRELTALCSERDVQCGRIEAIGAVQRARIGVYNQSTREYEFRTLDRPLEITTLIGNVSLKHEKPMIHAHITLGDHEGKAYGGHLASGTVVFACEYILQRIEGDAYVREVDEETGLPLWKL